MSQTDSQLGQVDQVTVVGTGLLGGSIGLGLRAAGYGGRIVGVGRREQTVRRAVALGCMDEATTDLTEAVGAEARMLVVLATPLGVGERLLTQLAGVGRADMVVTDVGSTKQRVCAAARRLLPRPGRFVGSHPMAGGEQHGPDRADAGLFRDKPCIITTEPDTDADALSTVESLWSTLGMRLIRMSATEHDRRTAAISHLPHAVAALLVDLGARAGGLDIASTGFRDTTRVASGDPRVWVDIFLTNRQAVLDAIDSLSGDLASFRQLLEDDDHGGILDLLTGSKATRDRWQATSADDSETKGV